MMVRIAKREREICARLRTFRLSLKWSQPNFAQELKITRDRLANYEYGRTPIPYGVAKHVCESFRVNQAWLATGEGEVQPFIRLRDDPVPADLDPATHFSQVFDQYLAERVRRVTKLFKADPRLLMYEVGVLGDADAHKGTLHKLMHLSVDAWLSRVPVNDWGFFLEALRNEALKIVDTFAELPPSTLPPDRIAQSMDIAMEPEAAGDLTQAREASPKKVRPKTRTQR